jgi:hypothetical protein
VSDVAESERVRPRCSPNNRRPQPSGSNVYLFLSMNKYTIVAPG